MIYYSSIMSATVTMVAVAATAAKHKSIVAVAGDFFHISLVIILLY